MIKLGFTIATGGLFAGVISGDRMIVILSVIVAGVAFFADVYKEEI